MKHKEWTRAKSEISLVHLSICPNVVVSVLVFQPLGIGQFCIDVNFCCEKFLALIVGGNNLDSVASHQKSLGAVCL